MGEEGGGGKEEKESEGKRMRRRVPGISEKGAWRGSDKQLVSRENEMLSKKWDQRG